jgi:sugar lactone lactonase YvrE
MSGAVYDAVDAAGKIYVTSVTADAVTVYAAGATGNVAPIATISGANTGLQAPTGIAVDAAGNIYVGDENTNVVSVFAPGANGNVAPIRTIAGAATGLSAPLQMVVGP